MGGAGKEVGGNEGDHLGVAAAIFAQVEDDGVHVGKEIHGGNGGGPAHFRVSEKIELQVADVAGEDVHLVETAVHALHVLAVAGALVGIRRAFGTVRHRRGAEVHAEMLVVADFLKILGQLFGEGVTVGDGIVVTFLLF